MPSRFHSINEFEAVSKTIYHWIAAALIYAAAAARGADMPVKFLGANSCASTSCHGGGGAGQNQFLTWSLKDFHSQRPSATLTTARSKQIADTLEIKDPAADSRCTSCHMPLHEVPENLRGDYFNATEGVSCESCHGPAETWLRSHTRTDYTPTDRTAAGMRDLQNLYVRANVCVACHQTVSPPLLQAGHPELIFELDGQSVAEPKHWSAGKNGSGAQAWLVGQAVALRETSWELAGEKSPLENELNRWRGLVWLVARASENQPALPATPSPMFRPDEAGFQAAQKWADQLALKAAELPWTDDLTESILSALAKTAPDFAETVPPPVQARRAERLVLALDRLLAAKNSHQANGELNQLFRLVQSLPDFDPNAFNAALQKFSQAVGSP